MKSTLLILSLFLLFACDGNNNTGKSAFEKLEINGELKIDSATGKAYDEEGNFVGIVFVPKKNDKLGMLESDLNGRIYYKYILDSSGRKIKNKAFKYEYHSEDFSVDINNDTIYVGEKFIGYISFEMKNGNKAIIDNEDSPVVVERNPNKTTASDFQTYEHIILTENVGVEEFKGKIVVDGLEHSFRYKYVVIAR